jgi:hypothetical protein
MQLQVWSFFRHNGILDRTNYQTDPTIDTSIKIDPIPIGTSGIFAWTFMDTGDRASRHTVSNPFTNIRNDRVSHNIFSIILKLKLIRFLHSKS